MSTNIAMKPLVDYSDSDESGDETMTPAHAEQKLTPTPANNEQKPHPATTKSAPPKLVDRANPSKITINLPTSAEKHTIESEAPVAKKQKTSGGGIFANMKNALPAPKKTGSLPGKRGLGSGVSLKTGADKAFSKERVPVEPKAPVEKAEPNDTANTTKPKDKKPEEKQSEEKESEDKLVWKKPDRNPWEGMPIFKPQAVLQAEAKKKKKLAAKAAAAAAIATESTQATSSPSTSTSAAPAKSKFAFDLGLTPQFEPETKPPPAKGPYEPMFFKTANSHPAADLTTKDPSSKPMSPSKPADSHGLDSLNLSAADRRVLFGRKGQVPEGLDMKTFNVDEQYAANQEFAKSEEAAKAQAKYATSRDADIERLPKEARRWLKRKSDSSDEVRPRRKSRRWQKRKRSSPDV
jgi:hypothetical protein